MFQLHFSYVQKKWCIVGVLAFLGPNLVSLLCCKVDISGVLDITKFVSWTQTKVRS